MTSLFQKQLLCVSGLPRSGSTLLCQLLAHHPELYCLGHSSPLCRALVGLRHSMSDDDFLKSQLDVNFELGYERLGQAYRGFLSGWFAETDKAWVVDKNRGWLQHIEMLNYLVPNFRILVCVRELGQVYGSIESQHQKTILLDFPDHLASLSRHDRADKLFANQGVIGSALGSIESLKEIDSQLQKQVYYVIFEHLMLEPITVMKGIFDWMKLAHINIDPKNLSVKSHESDSYYRFKYLHRTHQQIHPPKPHRVPERIQQKIQQNFPWFYQTFYPGQVN